MSQESELQKWADIVAVKNTIDEFLDFCSEKGVMLSPTETSDYVPCSANRENLILEFFKIDANKLDKERRELLDRIRSK